MIQLPNHQELSGEQREELNLSEMFCCYTVRCVLINEASYCLNCAAARTEDLHKADIRFHHSTLNELASRQAPLYDGPNCCCMCNCPLVMIGDAAECADCVDAVCAMYRVAITDGLIDVVTETQV